MPCSTHLNYTSASCLRCARDARRPVHVQHMGSPGRTACCRDLSRVRWTERSEEITCPACKDLQAESDAQQAAFEEGR